MLFGLYKKRVIFIERKKHESIDNAINRHLDRGWKLVAQSQTPGFNRYGETVGTSTDVLMSKYLNFLKCKELEMSSWCVDEDYFYTYKFYINQIRSLMYRIKRYFNKDTY